MLSGASEISDDDDVIALWNNSGAYEIYNIEDGDMIARVDVLGTSTGADSRPLFRLLNSSLIFISTRLVEVEAFRGAMRTIHPEELNTSKQKQLFRVEAQRS